MFNFNFKRDGYLKASDLQEILVPVAELIREEFDALEQKIKKQDEEVRKLKRELETERRLRLSMKGK